VAEALERARGSRCRAAVAGLAGVVTTAGGGDVDWLIQFDPDHDPDGDPDQTT
jgi:hypothetical protein